MAKARDGVEVRQRVYDAVRRYPGIHLREIERQIGVSAPLAQYHLRKLAEEGFVEVHEQGGYARHYPTDKGKSASVTPRDLPIVGLLREEVPLHIALLLLDRGAMTHAELVEALGVAKSTVSYHLAKLAEADVVERAGDAKLRLKDRERVYRLLLAYRPTPTLVDAFADLWEDLYG
ncbi:MAG TPA: ArsR family transcriptional regulator [Candidatus Thermoplasmatota archaeon]|nr:ArsR family transcriptional regulator [Candidatus Thermoplasmatota archaeon]